MNRDAAQRAVETWFDADRQTYGTERDRQTDFVVELEEEDGGRWAFWVRYLADVGGRQPLRLPPSARGVVEPDGSVVELDLRKADRRRR